MNINTTPLKPQLPMIQKQTPPAGVIVTEVPSMQSPDKVTWGGAAVGLVGAAAGGAITGAGVGLSSIKHSALGTVEAYKSLWNNETIGPVLKVALGALLPVAAIGVPVLSAVSGAAVGLYTGFVQGATKGLSDALSASTKNVKAFNQKLAPEARGEIRAFGEQKLEDGESKFDISPLKGVGAVAAGLGNTVVGAVGIGASTISQIPEAFITANKVIGKSDFGLPLKTVAHVVTVPLAVAAAPLGIVGGALFGLGSGTYHGYNDGVVDAFQKTGDYVGDYHKIIDKGLASLADNLVNG